MFGVYDAPLEDHAEINRNRSKGIAEPGRFVEDLVATKFSETEKRESANMTAFTAPLLSV